MNTVSPIDTATAHDAAAVPMRTTGLASTDERQERLRLVREAIGERERQRNRTRTTSAMIVEDSHG